MPEYAEETSDWQKVLSGFSSGSGVDSIIPKDLGGKDAVLHREDAIDFEGEDELADDELPEEEEPLNRTGGGDELEDIIGDGLAAQDGYGDDVLTAGDDDDFANFGGEGWHDIDYGGVSNSIVGELEPMITDGTGIDEKLKEEDVPSVDYDDELEQLENQMNNEISEQQLLKIYYPDFKPGSILKMNSLFGPKSSKLSLPKPKVIRNCAPTRTGLEVEIDQKSAFKSTMEKPRLIKNIIHVSNKSLEEMSYRGNVVAAGKEKEGQENSVNNDLLLASVDWDQMDTDESSEGESSYTTSNKTPSGAPRIVGLDDDVEFYNSDDEDALLEGTFEPARKKVKLDLNDPKMLFAEESRQAPVPLRKLSGIPTSERQMFQRYNISNDRAYDMLKENYQSKVRSTIGNLNIDHSMVALRLQSPHYKVKLSKAQTRSHHRPSFVVKPNTTIQFSKVKQRKKKKDKGKHISQLLNKTSDLTFGDSAQFLMLEYSEEFPLVLSNFGMGSKLINYYRKKNAEDTTRPKLPTGETHVLSTQDRSAFWNFGFVEPGNVVPTLYNKMIRAPVFKHEPKSTDFLLVRTTGGGSGQKYYLKTIPHLFTVGQTFPVTTVPGPHSRKVTTASKNRLKMVVYRVLNQNERHRLLVKDISAHFPDQNDMQNRQRLKEFMEYQRNGEDQGYWKVKASEPLPSEESIRAMISPEDITLLEAMQVGQQHLEDAGYGKTVDDDKEDQDGMGIEEQLAPWNITRNFINATQGKAMLQLHGEGDPSGRGEAFSFLKTSMKGGFKSVGESVNEKLDKSKYGGHSYNVAMQQKAYDEEIARIWYTQKRSLEATNTEDLGWDDAESRRERNEREDTAAPSEQQDDSISMYSQSSNQQQSNKVLRITRFVKDENGTKQRRVEVVRDPNVIRAYVKRRQSIEDSQLAPDEIAPTNDEEKNKRNLKILENELARLQRNHDRRVARNALKANSENSTQQSGKGIGKGKSTTRKCATCGAIGHIRTK
jgi:hypothetical protein